MLLRSYDLIILDGCLVVLVLLSSNHTNVLHKKQSGVIILLERTCNRDYTSVLLIYSWLFTAKDINFVAFKKMHCKLVNILLGRNLFYRKDMNKTAEGWMDDRQFYVFFNSVSVISGRLLDGNEKLCTMEPHLRMK